jgi:hypothetical protein
MSFRRCSNRDLNLRPSLEPLEGRQLLTLGPGFIVNTTTTGTQKFSDNASSGNGTSVAVWTDFNGEENIRAQRFDASGAKLGPELIVWNRAYDPAVAMDSLGDFVVSWTEQEANGDTNVLAQKYNSAGVPVNGVVQVGVGTFLESGSDVAMDAWGGDFVVSYTRDTNNDNPDIYAKHYNASSQLVGVITVSASSSVPEVESSIAMSANGRFDIAYQAQYDATDVAIFVKEYSAAGGLLATIPVATSGVLYGGPSISMDDFANAVVAYNEGNSSISLVEAKRISYTGVLGAPTDFSGGGFASLPSVALRVGGGPYLVAYDDAQNHVDVSEVSASDVVVATWTADATFGYVPAISTNGLDQFLVTDSTINLSQGEDWNILGHFGNLTVIHPLTGRASVASDLTPTRQPDLASATWTQSSSNTAGLTTFPRSVVNTTRIVSSDASKEAGGTGALSQYFPGFSVKYFRRSGVGPYGDRMKIPTQSFDQRHECPEIFSGSKSKPNTLGRFAQ